MEFLFIFEFLKKTIAIIYITYLVGVICSVQVTMILLQII